MQKMNIRKILGLWLFLVVSLLFVLPSQAVQPDEILANPQLEQRARIISAKLRCLVCRNETIDDSNAPLAKDLRLLVRERLQAGDSNQQVIDFIVARYGEYVLLKPPFWSSTIFLWLFPFLVFLFAVLYLYFAFKKKQRLAQNPNNKAFTALSKEEEAQLSSILAEDVGTQTASNQAKKSEK